MSTTIDTAIDTAVDTVTGLVWPDARSVSDADRATARTAVDAATASGRLPAAEAGYRRAAIDRAARRGDLRHALRGVAGGVPPQGLTTALGVVAAVWVIMSVVQVLVWLTIAVASGGPDAPWWLYSTVVGGGIVGALWFANESFHRSR